MDTFFVEQMKNPPKTTIYKADTGLKKFFMKEVLIINNCSFLDGESHNMLPIVTRNLENLYFANKKQKLIKSY